MSTIHDQLRARRKQLALRQDDMRLRIGMPRQQYHRLENGGNPSLKTLELVAAGLDLAVMLIPKERLHAVKQALAPTLPEHTAYTDIPPPENPWTDLLGIADD